MELVVVVVVAVVVVEVVMVVEATASASGVALVVVVDTGRRGVSSVFDTGVVDDKTVEDSLLLLDRKEWVHGWDEEGRPDLGPREPIWEKGSKRRRLMKQERQKRKARMPTMAKTRKWTSRCSCAGHVAQMGVEGGEEGTRVDIRACRDGRSRGARRPTVAADACRAEGRESGHEEGKQMDRLGALMGTRPRVRASVCEHGEALCGPVPKGEEVKTSVGTLLVEVVPFVDLVVVVVLSEVVLSGVVL